MKQWYAVSVSAKKVGDKFVTYKNIPAAVPASSPEEACGLAMEDARKTSMPESDGWEDFKASAIVVPIP